MKHSTGILTFINTLNYGAELQAYALTHLVSLLGYDAELVNYNCSSVSKRETPRLPGFGDLSNPKRFVGQLMKYPELKERAKGFEKFTKNYIPVGTKVKNASDILNLYDRVIVGSDQVWCPQITGCDMTYVLDGKHREGQRIISYAASFGDKMFPKKCVDYFSTALLRFDALSVREERGLEILASLGITDAVVSIDPTLLLVKNEWEKFVKHPTNLSHKYVLAYVVSERDQTIQYAKQAATKLGVDLLYIDAYSGRPVPGARNVGDVAPDAFLSLIHDAELVVTSSFHGLCFSVLFNKEFRYSLSTKKQNSRLYNLALQLGVEHYDIENTNLSDRIDYVETNRRMGQYRDESIDYLKKALA